MDRFEEFAETALAQKGCETLEKLLRTAPSTDDPEELALRHACWAALVEHTGEAQAQPGTGRIVHGGARNK
jgi:hypothetical protein